MSRVWIDEADGIARFSRGIGDGPWIDPSQVLLSVSNQAERAYSDGNRFERSLLRRFGDKILRHSDEIVAPELNIESLIQVERAVVAFPTEPPIRHLGRFF